MIELRDHKSEVTTMKSKIQYSAIDIGSVLGWTAGIILLCLFIAWVGYGIVSMIYDTKGPFAFDAEHIAYQVKDYTIRSKVEVLDVIREKDKETMYKIELTDIDKKYEISESTYMKFIGADANALTINASTISMAVKAGNFGKSWDEAKTYSVYRYKMPWESDTISFTQTEIQQFFDLLCEDKTSFRCYNLPFKYHNYATGWSFDIDEKESHIEWSHRT